MNPMWLLRAKRWVQNPPPMKRVALVICVIVACGMIYGIEALLTAK